MTDLKLLPKVIGTKQTIRALEAGNVKVVVLASDSDEKIRKQIITACADAQVKLLTCKSKRTLGIAGGIQRDAAVVAVLND